MSIHVCVCILVYGCDEAAGMTEYELYGYDAMHSICIHYIILGCIVYECDRATEMTECQCYGYDLRGGYF